MGKLTQAVNLAAFAAGRCRPLTGPVKVIWEVTYKCNSRCKHCHLWQVKEHNDLTTDEAKTFISDIKKMGALHLSFSGGEPFLRPDMLELMTYASELGLTTGVNTNGSRLGTPEAARAACKTGLGTVYISLDGADAEMHNGLRGTPKAFDSALLAIDNLIAQREGGTPRVFINTTVTRNNIESLDRILDLARQHGVDGMTMSMIQEVNKYSPEAEASMGGVRIDDLSKRLNELAKRSDGIIPHSKEYLDNFSTYLQDPGELYKYRCVAGYATALVHPDGEVHPCPVAFCKMGNLREKSFADIWFSPEADKVRHRVQANQHPICWFDCVAPMNVLLHDLRKMKISHLLHKKTLAHILHKMPR